MKKKNMTSARQLLAVCYGLAAVLWVVWCMIQSAVMLTWKLKGEMPYLTLTVDDIQTESFERYDGTEWWTAPDGRPDWYLSTSNDPHIFWQGRGYLQTVRLEVALAGETVWLSIMQMCQLFDRERSVVASKRLPCRKGN